MILLIADSVCGGFGQPNKKSFVHHALEAQAEVLWDHSASGMSTAQYLKFIETGARVSKEQHGLFTDLDKFELVIISLGNVDQKGCFENNNAFSRLVPIRYRSEKIDPRPYYSTKYIKRVIQSAENMLRTFFRHYLSFTGNLTPKVCEEDMKSNILNIMKIHDSSKILLLSPSVITDELFPGSFLRFEKLNRFLMALADSNSVFYFDMRKNLSLSHLMEDRFHLNQQGHQFVKGDFEIFLKKVIAK